MPAADDEMGVGLGVDVGVGAGTSTVVRAASHELPIHSASDTASFDIVETYHRLLAEDPDLIMPLAAIEAMIEALRHMSSTTVHETMDLLKAQSAKLQSSVANPIPVYHGTDLFQQYFLRELKKTGPDRVVTSSHKNFEVVREQLLRSGAAFVLKAKRARETIAIVGRRYIRDGSTILTHGGSRAVEALLTRATEHFGGDAPRRFKVIHVVDKGREHESERIVKALRDRGVKVATVPETAVAFVMGEVDRIIVGAEAVTSNAGIISRLGTCQIALTAQASHPAKPLFVAVEQYKFGDTYPSSQFNLGFPGFKQNILDFQSTQTLQETGPSASKPASNPVDYTSPKHITSFFTDQGELTPHEVRTNILDFIVEKPVDLPM